MSSLSVYRTRSATGLHPLMGLAALSVTIAALAVTASTLGWTGSKASAQASPLSVASPVLAAPAQKPPAARVSIQQERAATTVKPVSTPAVRQAPLASAGSIVKAQDSQPSVPSGSATVVSLQTVQQKAEPSGVGAVAGGLIGGLLGNQLGDGRGRTLGAVVGAVGGGLAGHEIEKRVRTTTVHEMTVRLPDGSTRSFQRAQPWDVRVGEVIALPSPNAQSKPKKPVAPSTPESDNQDTRA